MTKISIEVLDENSIDCEYYGLAYVSRMITLVKSNGNLQLIVNNLQNKLEKDADLITQFKQQSEYVIKLRNQIQSLKKQITASKRNLTIARKAVAKIKTQHNDLQDPSIIIHEAKVQRLKNELDIASETRDLLEEKNLTNLEEDIFYKAVSQLFDAWETSDSITLTKVFNTVLGATALYDALIDDGWIVESPLTHTMNHLIDENGYNNNESIVTIPDQFNIYASKHNANE